MKTCCAHAFTSQYLLCQPWPVEAAAAYCCLQKGLCDQAVSGKCQLHGKYLQWMCVSCRCKADVKDSSSQTYERLNLLRLKSPQRPRVPHHEFRPFVQLTSHSQWPSSWEGCPILLQPDVRLAPDHLRLYGGSRHPPVTGLWIPPPGWLMMQQRISSRKN